MKTITVKIVTQYGNERVFPACPTSQLLADLAGKLTFSPEHIRIIRELGYTVEVQAPIVSI